MFYTGSHKEIELKDIPNAILEFYKKNKGKYEPINIIIGTDSQNFSTTKIVSVIAVVTQGHGGIFFYEIKRTNLIENIRLKLYTETSDSLNLAQTLVEMLESDDKYTEMYNNCPISIHIDAGNTDKCKTQPLIPELVGWIKAYGYDVKTKPESFVASSIADRFSK